MVVSGTVVVGCVFYFCWFSVPSSQQQVCPSTMEQWCKQGFLDTFFQKLSLEYQSEPY